MRGRAGGGVAGRAGVAQRVAVQGLVPDAGVDVGDPGSDGETYIGSILHNVTNLTKAWDGSVADIPDSLKDWTPMQTEVR